jgi:hypothetical protein
MRGDEAAYGVGLVGDRLYYEYKRARLGGVRSVRATGKPKSAPLATNEVSRTTSTTSAVSISRAKKMQHTTEVDLLGARFVSLICLGLHLALSACLAAALV